MTRIFATCGVVVAAAGLVTAASAPQLQRLPAPAVEKLGDNRFRIGQVRIDTAARELRVTGKMNDVTILEFVANTTGGFKAYESAISMDTDALTFNAALLLLGLDPARARVPTRHFDPVPPAGDPVEIWVEGPLVPARGSGPNPGSPLPRRIRVEELLLDRRTNTTLPEGPWVYTGSSFLAGRYLADVDGVLIGFVHSPAPILESPRAGAVDAYGSVVLNTAAGFPPGMVVTVIVKAIGPRTP